jgi:DNA-binding transcriptional LysR family regulator
MARNDLRYMESAVALAETLNFKLAAQTIHISQPTLSRDIAHLERRLGFQIFERDHKDVRANEACHSYVKEARLALLHSERAIQAAKATMQHADLVLNIGRSPYTDPFLTTVLLSLELPMFPQLRIDLSSRFSYDLVQDLLAGTLDLAIATEPLQSPLRTSIRIDESPFYIAMSKEHELAKRAYLDINSLADRSWILFERGLHPPLYDTILSLAEMRGVTPTRIGHVVMPEESFPFLSDGSSIAFLVKSGALRMARDGITIRPLVEESLLLKTYLVSLSDNKSKAASELVRRFVRKLSAFREVKSLPLSA